MRKVIDEKITNLIPQPFETQLLVKYQV